MLKDYSLELDLERKWEGRAEGGPPPFLSISSAELYRKCPKAWEFRYLIKPDIGVRDEEPLFFGSLVHKIIEAVYTAYLATDIFLPMGDIEDLAKTLSGKYNGSPAKQVRMAQEAVKLVMSFLATGGRTIRPVVNEMEFLMRGPEGLRILGAIDLTTVDGVKDIKVSWHPREMDVATDQLNVYAAVFRLMTGEWPKDLEIINIVRSLGKTKYLTVRCNPDEVARTLDGMVETWKSSREAPYYAVPTDKNCRFCDFKDVCEERRKATLSSRTFN